MPSERACCAPHRDGGHRHVRPVLGVLGDQLAKIHPVKLVAAQDEQVLEVMRQKMQQVLSHGVGRALVPGRVGESLFRRQNLHKAPRKMIELV